MLMPVLTPRGVLTLRRDEEAQGLEPAQGARLEQAFLRGPGHGLLALGADEVATALPTVLSYLRDFGARYVTALCALHDLGEGNAKPPVPLPGDGDLAGTAAAVPPMTGAEYLTAATLAELWRATDAAFDAELADAALSVQEFLKARNPAWNLVGRVHFNLAENRKDEEAPFAFLATYTTRRLASAKAQHMPLGKALQEYAGANNRERLLSLLMPVQRAAELCGWLKAMVDAGEIFHPLRWSPQQALQFLKDAPALETAGVVVRMPASWRMNRPARPQVKATVGGRAPSTLGIDALLDFTMEVTLDGERLSAAELKRLLDELGIAGYPKTTGNRGLHVYVRLEPRWDSYQVRAAAVAVARELERRRPELITAAWWKEERGRRVFVDYNQNAPHKTVFGAWSVRARPGAQVSAPLTWDDVDALHPDELTIATVPARLAAHGDPWEAIGEQPQSLEPLLELHERDRSAGLMDAPWPPVYPKQPDEPPRVAPSRARKDA